NEVRQRSSLRSETVRPATAQIALLPAASCRVSRGRRRRYLNNIQTRACMLPNRHIARAASSVCSLPLVGEGWGGGGCGDARPFPQTSTPTPSPSPQGGGACTECAASLHFSTTNVL